MRNGRKSEKRKRAKKQKTVQDTQTHHKLLPAFFWVRWSCIRTYPASERRSRRLPSSYILGQ